MPTGSVVSQSPDSLLPSLPSGMQAMWIYHQAASDTVSDLHTLNFYLHLNFVTAHTQTQITLLAQDVLSSKIAPFVSWLSGVECSQSSSQILKTNKVGNPQGLAALMEDEQVFGFSKR